MTAGFAVRFFFISRRRLSQGCLYTFYRMDAASSAAVACESWRP